ncbi:hypothetical protein GCM10010350_79570 [Streptomyces galilaeus]|nr:hypothetical protein GCM10010350_79570 [Streptomyces galilaeus]
MFIGNSRVTKRVDLPGEVLSGGTHTGVRKIHPVTAPQLDTVARLLTGTYDTRF